MDNCPLLIFGSARSDGTTKKVVNELFKSREIQFIDLLKKNVSYFDYKHTNRNDDFLKIAAKMANSRKIVFATPVYWYSMSAVMKTFFDRLTDLLQVREDIGRSLKNKNNRRVY